MSIILTQSIIDATTDPSFGYLREQDRAGRSPLQIIDPEHYNEAALINLMEAAVHHEEGKKIGSAIKAILDTRQGGTDLSVPNFFAFKAMLTAHLRKDVIDGWVYKRRSDGRLYPYLVSRIEYEDSTNLYRDKKPQDAEVKLFLLSVTVDKLEGRHRHGVTTETFSPSEVLRKRMDAILESHGLYKETPALKAEYLASMDHFNSAIRNSFGQQFRLNGIPKRSERTTYYEKTLNSLTQRRVVLDSESDTFNLPPDFVESALLGKEVRVQKGSEKSKNQRENVGFETEPGLIPFHPLVRVFDLKEHTFYQVHADCLTPYVYDESLRDKLILPDTHRELLDVLTTDLDSFVEDIIEGKAAGNVILCKGRPGVGKTLTAECYAEIMKRPLYMVHTGILGTDAKTIENNLSTVFERIKRWNAVGLLDEADVFVMARGSNIEQNAIVSVFLRTLEYFDGLLFLTTNRPDDIDEAILVRFAAIINYEPPGRDQARKVWHVLADQFKIELDDKLVDSLLDMFPEIAPRDIKMLLRRTMRLCLAKNIPLSPDEFRRSAMFQNVKIAPVSSAVSSTGTSAQPAPIPAAKNQAVTGVVC